MGSATRPGKKMPGKKKVTLEHIARSAGVSLASASRVLSGTGSVSSELERKVRNAVQRLGANRSSATRTGLVGVLLGNRPILHGFHSRVMCGVESFFLEHDYSIVVAPVHYGEDIPWNEVPLPQILQLRRVLADGFVVVGTNSQNLLDLLKHLDRPFAIYGNNMCGDWEPALYDCVFSDDFGGGYEVTQYLIKLGHRHIWFLAACDLPWRRRRFEGYCKALEKAGLKPHIGSIGSEPEIDAGYLATKALLSSGAQVDAILAGGDPAAQGAYEALRECQRRVGIDVSVAGFDDFSEARALHPQLTTVCTFPEEIGRRLAGMVWRRLEEPALPFENVVVPTRLIRRDSVGTVPDVRAVTQDHHLSTGRDDPLGSGSAAE